MLRMARRSDRPQKLTLAPALPGVAARVSSRPANEDRFRASIRRALALGWLTEFRRRLYESLTGFELVDRLRP